MPLHDIADRYDRQAPAFLESMASMLLGPGLVILREFEGLPARRVLDVGAGVGVLLPSIQAAFPEATVLGCDGSPGMLRLRPEGSRGAVMDAAKAAARKDRRRKPAAEYVEQLAQTPPKIAGVDVPRCLKLILRDTRASMAFGHGPHYCVGINIARSELHLMLDAALDFLPSKSRLLEDDVVWSSSGLTSQIKALPVDFRG